MELEIRSFIEKKNICFSTYFWKYSFKKHKPKVLNCQLLKNVQMLEAAGKIPP